MKAYPVTVLCSVMQVSRSGFYDYLHSGTDADDPLQNQELKSHIRTIFKLSRGSYGSRRMLRQLQAEGYQIGRYKVRRLMCQLGLKAKMRRRFKVTTESRHSFPVAFNILDRRFDATEPNTVWATDISVPQKAA